MPGAKVTLANVDTGVVRAATTNNVGRYFFPLVVAGQYTVSVELAGFQTFTQSLRVQTGIASTIDATMKVGEVRQVTTVTGEGPLVETASASLGAVVANRQIKDLPLAGRNPYQLVLLSPGVTQTFNPASSDLQDLEVSYFSTNGASKRYNEFLMDGIPNSIAGRVDYIAPVDQVEEFNVQTNTFDAEFGRFGGAMINVVTKSGTNQYHGSVYEFLRNSAFDANKYFSNMASLGKPPYRYNQFGGTLGGPVVKNKMFFFANYEGIRTSRPSPAITTAPTSLQRAGDFGKTFDQKGALIKIFDPYSTRADAANPGKFIRTQFPNNVIPVSSFDKVSKNLLDAFVPLPNSPGDAVTGVNNYVKTLVSDSTANNISLRMDYELNSRHRLFGRYSRSQTDTLNDMVVDVGGRGIDKRVQSSIGLNHTFTISPATIIDWSAGFSGYTRLPEYPDADMLKYGFPLSFVSQVQQQKIPNLIISDMMGFGAPSASRWDVTNTWTWQANMRHTRGRHSLKWGLQNQTKQNNSGSGNRPMGEFTFTRAFTQGADPNAQGSALGSGIASYLLGTPASGRATTDGDVATTAPYYGFYIQDDIRVNQRLTLNLGLRYEFLLAATERYNRQAIGYAYDVPNPIQDAARAAYARSPIPELPVDQFRVMGGLLFASPSQRRGTATEKNDWSPRIGLSYRLNDKTVLRAGVGTFYSFYWAPFVSQVGFSSETPFTASLDGITPANVLSNPFPNGLIKPVGAADGLKTLLGTSLSFYNQYRTQPYNRRWSFGIQRELMRDTRLEVDYVGQTAWRLPLGTGGAEEDRDFRYLPSEYLKLGSRLQQTVPNPFYGLIPTGALAAKTISVQNLLMTYPQFTAVTAKRVTEGKSYYHSLQTTVNRRFSRGFQFQSSYTWSKTLEWLRYLNASDPLPAKQIGEFDRPHRFTFGGVFEMPFGPGRRWVQRGIPAKLAGGWQLNVLQTFQSGEPIPLGNVDATGKDPLRPSSERSRLNWFNKDAFVNLPAFTLR
ncbi:MAG: TonB-dependent receptor [Acidobacteria bacterium]|nr:TonB-dependent receptor [Acidobacteriota bacterium]